MTTLANLVMKHGRGHAPARAPRIDAAHLRALLAADARRLGPSILRSVAAVLAIAMIALATGVGNRGLIAGMVGALLVMHPMFLALQLVRDKVDGNLTFLCALPVTPETLAAVRVVPVVALSGAGGVAAAAIALWNGLPGAVAHGPAAVAVAIALLGTLVPAALASVLLALGARLSFETLASLPMLALFGLAVLGKTVERIIPDGAVAPLHGLVAQPWAPVALIALLCGALAGTVALALRVTAGTFARFTPERRGG